MTQGSHHGRTKRARRILGRSATLLVLCSPSVALAGPWVEPERRTISALGYGYRAGLPEAESDIYSEIPLRPTVAGVVHTRVEATDTGDRSEAESGAKVVVRRWQGAVAAVQGQALWTDSPSPGCGPLGAELRALGGAGGSKGNTFAAAEVAWRLNEGDCAHVRADFTAGWKPTGNWLAMAQVFIDQDLQYDHVLKAQASLVRFGRRGRGVQIGVRAEIERGEFIAPTLVIGYWSPPTSRSGR